VTDTEAVQPSGQPARSKGERRGGPVRALQRRTRETVAEMRKVLWPSRNEMVTYTVVVVIFVVIMVSLVAGLDFGLAKAVLAVFG
jgi:preprotein translocase subunit SecE